MIGDFKIGNFDLKSPIAKIKFHQIKALHNMMLSWLKNQLIERDKKERRCWMHYDLLI